MRLPPAPAETLPNLCAAELEATPRPRSVSSSNMSDTPGATTRRMTPEDYELIYWPEIPGRGEPIRLCLEEGGASYIDTALADGDAGGGVGPVMAQIAESNKGTSTCPPPLAPPILRHGNLALAQLPNILMYLGPRLGLAPASTASDVAGSNDALYIINQLALTALDGLSNEPHDCHHPCSVSEYYEDQKVEARRRTKDYIRNRLPKFLGYFQRVLEGEASGEGPWLYGGALSWADVVLFQCVDGVKFAYPKAMTAAEKSGKYDKVFALHAAVQQRPRIKAYLESPRRQKYSMGIYRYYEELDLDLEE
ncbi:glutathione S-transferase family protein [Microdochium nivale]|nr:glutathione S-transferase family protein [Microdochium nivale]